jgi:hypothetical protein
MREVGWGGVHWDAACGEGRGAELEGMQCLPKNDVQDCRRGDTSITLHDKLCIAEKFSTARDGGGLSTSVFSNQFDKGMPPFGLLNNTVVPAMGQLVNIYWLRPSNRVDAISFYIPVITGSSWSLLKVYLGKT